MSAVSDEESTNTALTQAGFDQLRMAEMVAHAPIAMGLVDLEFRYLHVNDAMAAIHGIPSADHIGRPMAEIITAYWPRIEPLVRRAAAGEATLNVRFLGDLPPVHKPVQQWLVSFSPVHHEGTIVGVGLLAIDSTAQHEAEEALRVRNDLYAMLSRTNRAVSSSRTPVELYQQLCEIAVDSGRFRYAWVGVPDAGRVRQVAGAGNDNGYMRELYISLDPDDMLSSGPTGRCAMTGHWIVVNDFAASMITSPWRENARRAGFAASAAFPLKERGNVAAVLTLYAGSSNFFTYDLVETLAEITPSVSFALDRFVQEWERRRDEEALLIRDRALQAVSQGITIADATAQDLPIIFASPSFEALSGYRTSEVLGRNCRFLQGAGTDPLAVARLRDALSAGIGCTVEVLNYRKDGTPFWNSLAISPVHDMEGRLSHFVGVQTDVTERRRLEQQFRQAQKMEAVGRLAGGIAHDFNNLLTVINGYSDLALGELGPGHPARELLESIQQAGTRAGTLTRQLLSFSRQQVLEPKVINLNLVVRGLELMLRRLIGEDILLSTRLDPALGQINADPGQIEQILINLSVNARDAMPEGGGLTISTANATLGAEQVAAIDDLAPGEYVLLAVSDTGHGMDEATKSRIFEPFFTTKGIGKGTGLGLATVHGIVKQSRGHVTVDSEAGRGATFSIYLPRVFDAPGPEAAIAGSRSLPAGTETLLLVEDDDAVRALAMQTLRSCGYHVLEAANGRVALQVAQGHPGEIDLLVSDVVMPHVGGRDLALQMTKARPDCRVLLLSGYMDDVALREDVLHADYAFLQKPFTPSSLAQKVRALLDER